MSVVKEGKCHDYGIDYDTEFDYIAYLDGVFGPDALKTHPWSYAVVNDLHDIVQKLKLSENATQLNVGRYVEVLMVISSSRVCSDITLAEYTSKSRRILTRWLKGEDAGFSWTAIFDHIGQKEGRTSEEIENRTRASVKEILACDLLKKDIFGVARLPQFDIVSSYIGLEVTCKDIPQYNEAMMNLSAFIKPGGYLVLVTALNGTYYKVKGKKCFVLTLTKRDVENALASAGFEPPEWHTHEKNGTCGVGYDASELAAIVARKKE